MDDELAFCEYCRDLAGLKQDSRVLEIGCGGGQLARALEGFLGERGDYTGIDVVQEKIDQCRQQCRSPNFAFERIDVFNRNYNPGSKIAASSFRFPFKDAIFDLVVLKSVFTVMTADEAHHYLSEIARVLARGGRCLITFFLLNTESRRLLAANKIREFPYCWGICSTESPNGSHAVAYDEAYVKVAFMINGIAPREPITYGYWCGRPSPWYSQDIVVGTRL